MLRRASAREPIATTAEAPGVIEAGDLAHRRRRARSVPRRRAVVAHRTRVRPARVFRVSRPRRAFRRDELLERVWGFTYGDTATVTVHVRRLREKIEADPSAPLHLATVWGVGYRWDP